MTPMHAKERLYLTADKSRLVRHGDPKAAFLYASLGDEIPQSAADKFGLVDGKLKPAKAEKSEAEKAAAAKAAADKIAARQKAEADRAAKAAAKKAAEKPKEQKPAENKEQKPAENKGAGGNATT